MNVWKGRDILLSAYCVLFPLSHGRLQQPQLIKHREKMCYRIQQQWNKYDSWEKAYMLLQEGNRFVGYLRSDCMVIKLIPGFLTHLPETLQRKRGNKGTSLCLISVSQHTDVEKLRYRATGGYQSRYTLLWVPSEERMLRARICISLKLMNRKSIRNANSSISVQHIQAHLLVLLLYK